MNVVIERLILYNFFFVPAANKFFVWIIKNSVQELTISNFGPSIVFLGEQYTKLFMPKTITQTALRLAYSFFYGKSHRVQCRHKKNVINSWLFPFWCLLWAQRQEKCTQNSNDFTPQPCAIPNKVISFDEYMHTQSHHHHYHQTNCHHE